MATKKTGLIRGLPMTDYVGDPAPAPSLSASIAHTLLTRSPHHAWWEHPRLNPDYAPEEAEHLDIGTIVHAIVLEGDRSRIVVVDAPDWRTNAAKTARDLARQAGKLPILTSKMEAAQDVALAIQAKIAQSELAEVFKDGEPEVTLLWQEDGIWCRARPDWVSKDRRVLVDLKTTAGSAEPNAWARGPLLQMGYDLQAAHALRGLRAIEKQIRADTTFVFLVAELEPPYAISLVSLAPAFLAFAEAKLATARVVWRDCLRDQTWPSYPSRIAYAEPPGWARVEWEERTAGADDGRPLVEQMFGGAP
jgi:hypothetical protein